MENQSKPKLLVYLDQCSLSAIAKVGNQALFDKVRSVDMQLIYSYVHITETARCSNQEFQSKAMQALEEMSGGYIHEGKLHFDKTPQLRLQEHLSNPEVYSSLSDSMEKLAHKFFGGQQGKSFQNLIEAQYKPFADLVQEMVKNIEVLSESEETEIQQCLPMLKMLPELLQQEFEEKSLTLSATLEASFPSPETFNGSKEFRSFVGVDPNPLSNIRLPNILQKIWEQLNTSGKIPPPFNSASEFFANTVPSHMNDGKPTWETKISSLYHLLNMIGYCPDEKLHKEDGFRSSLGDQTHAAFAAFAHVFVTGDFRMAKKTYAVYEYLGIGTQVCFCKSEENGVITLFVGEKIFH